MELAPKQSNLKKHHIIDNNIVYLLVHESLLRYKHSPIFKQLCNYTKLLQKASECLTLVM